MQHAISCSLCDKRSTRFWFLMMRVFLNRRVLIIVVTIFFFLLTVVSVFTGFHSAGLGNDRDSPNTSIQTYEIQNSPLKAPRRKLLFRIKAESNPAHSEPATDEPTRMWGEKCSRSDILINQGPTSPLPIGIPTYTVEIMNVCVSGCDISGVHLTCGWFSSAHLVNPKVFKRLRYNDCLVNDGKTLLNGGTLSFQYANTFSYPFAVSAVVCT